MSAWRKKAIALFPDLRQEFEERNATIYSVFFALLERLRKATDKQEIEEIAKIYGFAEWCFRQKATALWNAAGVAFYEHLVDHRLTAKQIPHFIKPDMFRDLEPLFESRLGKELGLRLRKEYYAAHPEVRERHSSRQLER
jgi:hypothetical protein